tara:strand:+ start:1348 stop:1920 length:573 start_codon:yes stop_codon:yes gene_type:complete
MKINVFLEGKSKKDKKDKKAFTPHMMYDPNSNKKEMAVKPEDHKRLAAKGYVHIDPKKIRKIVGKQEGGATGMKPLENEFGKSAKAEIEKTLASMDDIRKHKFGDYIISDDDEIDFVSEIVKEEIIKLFLEKKRKKKRKKSKKKSSGKKDACYHKVKARYSVWPSAYASGALVKCRKVGAANWGNKSKKK